MILEDRFTGKDILFQGDRSLSLRRIPAGAKITKAQATIIPVNSSGSIGPSEDLVFFNNVTQGTNGETLTQVSQTPGWVEVDFHRRVTLISISGSHFDDATLQVDIGGGTFIEVNENGAFMGTGDPFTLDGDFHWLPGLTVNRIKLTQEAGLTLAVANIKVRNIATNVSLRISESSPFFLQPGDLVEKQSSVDFTGLLQANLQTLKANGGFYDVPIILHSDRLTRLSLEVHIELLNQQQVLPQQLSDVQLPYAYNAVSESNNKTLTASIPVGSRIVSEATGVKIEGSFANSKVVLGSFDELDSDLKSVNIDTGMAQAQAFNIGDNKEQQDIAIDAIDLLLTSVSSQVSLQLDLRADLDGKPDSSSLLTSEVKFNIDIDNAPSPVWTSIALNNPVTLNINRYWLLIQSLEGDAQWSVDQSSQDPFAGLQQSKDGGMSWRETIVSGLANRPEAQFRLRQNSETFHIPVEVKVGSDEQAKRLNLAKFEPLGRIDFALDSEEFSNTINDFVEETEQFDCPQGEQLVNHEFDLELDLVNFTLVSWQHTGGGLQPFGNPLSGVFLSDNSQTSGLSQTVPAAANCNYELTALASIDGTDSRIELIWSGDSCDPIRIDELILSQNTVHSTYDLFAPVYRLRTVAPELTTQVEVRLITPNDSSAFFDRVSLVASPQSLVNSDLLEKDKTGIVNWINLPDNAFEKNMLNLSFSDGTLQITNSSSFLQPAALSQTIKVESGKNFNLEFNGTARLNNGDASVFPEIRLVFTQADDNGDSLDNKNHESSLVINPDSSASHLLTGTIPESSSEAEIQLVIPRDTTLTVSNVLFESIEFRDIPITFLSEAPGELTVSDFRVGFEMQPAPLLATPEAGLCNATPADSAPGDQCEDSHCEKSDKSFCSQCRKQSVITDTHAIRLLNERPGLIGRCKDCGQPLIQNGGTLTADAILLPIRKIDRSRIEVDDSEIALSEVDYVGTVRTRILNENGITRMGHLAAADPIMLMEVLGISDGLAESLVTQAKKLLLTTTWSSRKIKN